jgi:transcriptional regulator with XRE-family HTH domain
MKDWESMSDPAVLREIGKLLKRLRLNQNRSQEEIATRAGLDRSTISQMENGRPASMMTFVQVLRAIGKMELLNAFSAEPQISPLQLAKLKGKQRERASADNDTTEKGGSEW